MNLIEHPPMLNELATQLPSGFPQALHSLIKHAYPEAIDQLEASTLLKTVEKENVFPHLRRGIIESQFRTVADSFGLDASSLPLSSSKGNSYSRVSSGRFILSVHHVDSFIGMPKFAQFRKQNSSVNCFLEQMFLDLDGDASIDPEKPIYIYVVHETSRDDRFSVGDVKIAIPKPERREALIQFDIFDVIAMQNALSASGTDSQDLVIRRKSVERLES